MRLLNWLLLGLAGLLCSGVILFICAIIFVGNDTKVSFGKELRSWHIATIVVVAKLPAVCQIATFPMAGDGGRFEKLRFTSVRDLNPRRCRRFMRESWR